MCTLALKQMGSKFIIFNFVVSDVSDVDITVKEAAMGEHLPHHCLMAPQGVIELG